MITLFIFFALFIGLNIKYHPLLAISVGIILILISIFRFKNTVKVIFIGVAMLSGLGMSYIYFDYEQDSYTGVVIEAKENYYLFSSQLERLYIYEKDNQKEIGDILTIEGKKTPLVIYRIESGFDFETYLNQKGIKYQFEVSKEEYHFSNFIRGKQYKEYILSHYENEDVRGLIGNIMFNDNEDYSYKNNLQSLHLNRLISSSGIYYLLLFNILVWIFDSFLKKKWSKLLAIIIFLPYVILLNGKFSLLRFFLFTLFRYINEYFLKKRFSFLDIYTFLGIGFIILDYHLVYLDSFFLGFCIPLLVRLIDNSFIHCRGMKKKVLISILILLFFLPFDIKYHQEIFLFSYLLQILFTPLFILTISLSYFTLLGIGIYPVVNLFAQILFNFSSLSFLSKASIYVPSFNEGIYLIYYGIYFLNLYYHSLTFRPIYKWLNLISICFSLIYISPIDNGLTDSVTFINVGQGDSCLITHKYTSILIDTGGSIYTDIANECLIPYFKSRRIYDIDLLITTHDDYDHMGALSSLQENFNVKRYVKDNNEFPLSIDGINFVNYNHYFSSSSEENDKSLVIGFHLLDLDFLIMGDAPISIEKKIMEDNTYLPCDILKVGHHGSKTSTSDEFIKFISPKQAIISVGRNYYGHPNENVINILKNNDVTIRQTIIEGSITYKKFIFA